MVTLSLYDVQHFQPSYLCCSGCNFFDINAFIVVAKSGNNDEGTDLEEVATAFVARFSNNEQGADVKEVIQPLKNK